MSISVSRGENHFAESTFPNFNQIIDFTQPDRGNFTAIGLGFFERIHGSNYRLAVDILKQAAFLGEHTIGVGYQYQRSLYAGRRDQSGPRFTIPAANASGLPITNMVAGQEMNGQFSLLRAAASCTLCPFLSIPGLGDQQIVLRGSGKIGDPSFDTKSIYQAAYVQDTWRISRYLTVLLGLRTEQERLIGNPTLESGQRIAYTFTGQWAPRVGITVDPTGKGKTRLYYNFGRFFEYIPLDLAQRALSTNSFFAGGRFAPEFFFDSTGKRRARLNEFGTVTPVIDAGHFLNRAAGGINAPIGLSLADVTNPFVPGTKLGFAEEHLIGLERQLPHNLVLSISYQDRRLKRIVEDGAAISPEAANAGIEQTFFIANINSKLDAATNLQPFTYPVEGAVPAGCLQTTAGIPDFETTVTDLNGNEQGNVCFGSRGIVDGASFNSPDGIPDGFPNPVHIYRAVLIEMNKRLSNNWQLLANWRIASLKGNFEGHFRNDNGQDDPALSTLFDFTSGEFGLLGDQNAVGPLNTDRHHVVNIYSSYAFHEKTFKSLGLHLEGLNVGAGLHLESGIPISEFLAHPIYPLSPGEVPVGTRGKLGRTPFYARLDIHADYPWKISEQIRLSFVADFFNVSNSRKVRQVNEFHQSIAGEVGLPPAMLEVNPDFLGPRSFHLPFSLRVGIRLEW